MSSSSRPPLICVVGATGTGKSKFAVEIAKAFNGEILNADALQLYKGLPITTNKIPHDERDGIPHHLLNIIPLDEKPWTAPRFVSAALEAIAAIQARGRMPVLVGGTHYYTQSLLFKDALADSSGEVVGEDLALRFPILNESTEELLAELRKVDPVMADRWHPSDRRKIRRSLEIFLTSGRPASEIYAKQRRDRAGSDQGLDIGTDSRLRFRTLVFWVHCTPEVLKPRLDKRVDGMLDAGLLEEARILADQHDKLLASGHDADLSSGLYIAIGYKEFLPYLQLLRTSPDPKQSDLQKALDHGVERTKIATRQYAKHQVQWIHKKLLRSIRDETDASMYLLDASDLSAWDAEVSAKGHDIAARFLARDLDPAGRDESTTGAADMPDPLSLSGAAAKELAFAAAIPRQEFVKQACSICDVVAVTQQAWTQHLGSRKHKALVAKQKRLALTEADRKTTNEK